LLFPEETEKEVQALVSAREAQGADPAAPPASAREPALGTPPANEPKLDVPAATPDTQSKT
jgi:hypothetical protein